MPNFSLLGLPHGLKQRPVALGPGPGPLLHGEVLVQAHLDHGDHVRGPLGHGDNVQVPLGHGIQVQRQQGGDPNLNFPLVAPSSGFAARSNSRQSPLWDLYPFSRGTGLPPT